MRKICFFNSSNFWGGGEKLHLENAKAFRKKGYQVTIAAHQDSELWTRAQDEGFETFAVQVGSTSFLNVFKLLRIKSYFQKEEIDTVIFTTSQDLKTASIAAHWAKCNKIVYLRGLATPIKNSSVNRYCMDVACTHLVANSQETKRTMLLHLGKHITADKIAVIYHGIDDKLLVEGGDKLPQVTTEDGTVILGNAGRLTLQKGHLHLIEVAEQLKKKNVKFKLYVAGTGELYDELQATITAKKLKNEVILLGFIADMEAFMRSIDIFILSSSWEGFGFVIVEAMAKGKPVVAFDITSNPEIITDGKTGLLAKHLEAKDLANQTARLISDTTFRKQMGQAAKQSVVDRFLIEERITELEAYLLKG
jgi:glycosyltransferase involved in cell wall biosynthesis|tara:strand:- start:474 stop:1565 length:1092 start_codon:yes stop_codon:yes gene_type:complete